MAKKKLLDIISDVVETVKNNNQDNETTEKEQAKTNTGKKNVLTDIIEDVVDAVKGNNKTDAQTNTGKKTF
ncbi:hypothetical protein C7N43_10555 [Sphingobacteriales bacterium UPWRP_1]|nr:hypothetical protein BVG80_13895 [Sphingobacteriales bacterium TSM_CSM]PSJ77073.1 hypothetical protein C7N43_10555 [Sphingobacteriales bacterium UPWRP_1]